MISTTEQANHNGCRQPQSSKGTASPETRAPITAAVLDCCSGMGGLSLAAKELGLHIVAGIDVNASALRTFAKNFPGAESINGSVRSQKILSQCGKLIAPLKAAGTPVAILSGPPCQGFSAAGSRNPVDLRNRVLVAVARAISGLQPECALIENVSMLLTDKHEERIEKFEQVLNDGRYHVMRVVLDASDFGVPQKRKRAFFFVTRAPLNEQDVMQSLEKFKIATIGAKETLRDLPRPKIRPDDYDDEKDYAGVHNHFAMQHSKRVRKKIGKIKPGTGPMSYRRLHPEKLSNTLFSGHRAPPAHYSQRRSITVREAARLQGFPDSFRIYGSFSNQMEQVTNAVPPPLAKAVLCALAEFTGIQLNVHG